MMKAVFEKGKPYTLSEQEISELPNVPEEKSIYSLKPVGQGHGQELNYGALAEGDGKQIDRNETEKERENIEKIVKSTEERELFLNKKSSGTLDTFKNYSDEKERHHHPPHYHPRSSSDSNTRFDPSSHDYRRDDNIRTHFHSKHPRSQSTGAPHNDDMRSDIAHTDLRSDIANDKDKLPDMVHQGDRRPDMVHQGDNRPDMVHQGDKRPDMVHQGDKRPDMVHQGDKRPDMVHQGDKRPDMVHQGDRRPYSPNRLDKSSKRTNRELNYDDKVLPSQRKENSPNYVQKREGQLYSKDSFHDLSPRTYHEKETSSSHKYGRGNECTADKSKADKTATSEFRSDTVNRQTASVHSARDENTNAFSSYAFQSKESGKPRRHLYGDLDLTPVYKSHGRVKERTLEISPLARRRTGSDTRGEQSGSGVRSLSTSVKQVTLHCSGLILFHLNTK